MTTATTPLLLLLDSILSQNVNRVRDARRRIYRMAQEAGYASEDGIEIDSSISLTSCWLAQDVNKLLTGYPHLASVPSLQDGSLPLHFAASIGNVDVARIIMSKFPSAATTANAKGKIPLHYAAREGRSDMVAFFLHTTPQTAEIKSKKDKLAIHFAAGDGHIDVVRRLLSVYPQSASIPSSKGKLPIHFASRWGNLEIAIDLLNVYPNSLCAADHEGSLPLHEAAREGQFQMSKFLIERYPAALSTTNIRGETPLFAAVRRGDLDLVILYLQAWPHGGRHILRSLTADDNVEYSDPRILELLLRSGVENFVGCEIIEGKDPPTFFGLKHLQSHSERELSDHYFDSSEGDSSDQDSDHDEANSEPPQIIEGAICAASISSSPLKNPAASAAATAFTSQQPPHLRRETSYEMQRTKSPVLNEQEVNKRRKRLKRKMESHDCESSVEKKLKPRHKKQSYLPLHAALACEASPTILRCVLKRGPADQLKQVDRYGQLPLHVALVHCCSSNNEETIQILLKDIIKPYPDASMVRDNSGRLPLHVALAAKADFRIIQALVDANPSSAVGKCKADIERFKNKMPIYMATEHDCDISTTYLLFRMNPSVIFEWKRGSAKASNE